MEITCNSTDVKKLPACNFKTSNTMLDASVFRNTAKSGTTRGTHDSAYLQVNFYKIAN